MNDLKFFIHLICQFLINKRIFSSINVNKKFQMQIRRVTGNNVICQQRLLSSNIKWILNKRNKKDIKWCFKLHNVFYKVWRFFEMFKSFSEESSSSLLLKYHALKSWQKSWLSNWNSIFLIWADLLIWGFVQSLSKWPDSPHF